MNDHRSPVRRWAIGALLVALNAFLFLGAWSVGHAIEAGYAAGRPAAAPDVTPPNRVLAAWWD